MPPHIVAGEFTSLATRGSPGHLVVQFFWARVQGPDSPGNGYGLAGEFITVATNGDWQRHEIVLDVPTSGGTIEYGVGLAGAGTLWLDKPSIEVLDRDITLAPTRVVR